MRRIQVFEWESLKVAGSGSLDGLCISPVEFDQLVAWQDSQQQAYFQVGHKRLTMTQWVGVVQTPSVSIEVLPKAEARGEFLDRMSLLAKWSKVLILMVSNALDLDIRQSDATLLNARNHSLLDLFFLLLIKEVEELMHQGLVKRYHREDRQRTALRGRFDFTKQIRLNAFHQERFFTSAQEYDTQHPINEILLAAIRMSIRCAWSTNTVSSAQNLVHCFPDWPARSFGFSDFDRIVIDRKTEGYQKALSLSKLVLLKLAPQIETGKHSVMGLFFDMNQLWEEWLRHLLGRMFLQNVDSRGRWLGQRGKKQNRFWSAEGIGKVVETDLLFEWNGKRYVLDAKWKVLTDSRPADADLKQMFVYGALHQAEHTGLVYPHIGQSNIQGRFVAPIGPQDMDMLFIPLNDSTFTSGEQVFLSWLATNKNCSCSQKEL